MHADSAEFNVVKCSGDLLDRPDQIESVFADGVKRIMDELHEGCIAVVGAGGRMTKEMQYSAWDEIAGERVTDPRDIAIVQKHMEQTANEVAALCDRLGIPHEIVPPECVIAEDRLGFKETGKVVGIQMERIAEILRDNRLAIMTHGGVTADGRMKNTNADINAVDVAGWGKAKRLLIVNSAGGILNPVTNMAYAYLSGDELMELYSKEKHGGNKTKYRSIMRALIAGVPQVHVVPASGDAIFDEVRNKTGSPGNGTLVAPHCILTYDYPASLSPIQDLTETIAVLRQQAMQSPDGKTPGGTPYVAPLGTEEEERARLAEKMERTIAVRHADVLVGSCFFDRLERDPAVAIFKGFVIAENNQASRYGRDMFCELLEKIWAHHHRDGDKKIQTVITFTGSEKVQRFFEKEGGRPLDEEIFAQELAHSKERYEKTGEQSYVRGFMFARPKHY